MFFTVILPVPPAVLAPNSRSHWRTKSAAAKITRADAKAMALRVMKEAGIEPPKWKIAHVFACYYFPTLRMRDRDNLLARMKPVFDGMQDAGVIENDNGLVHWPIRHEVDKKRPRLEVVIRDEADLAILRPMLEAMKG